VEELRVAIKRKLKKSDYKYTVIADPTEELMQTLGRCKAMSFVIFPHLLSFLK
jgi:hypothetical protein